MRQRHPLHLLLTAAELSRSTFYFQLQAVERGDACATLKSRIADIYNRHKGRYGYRRITAVLREAGETVNHKAVQRLMGVMGLKSLARPKKYRAYRGLEGAIAPNLLERQFSAEQPNEKWVTDVTEFKVGDKRLYLSPVMDLYNAEVVAYEVSERAYFELVGSMLKKAFTRLRKDETPLLHSDQGWQYQHSKYRNLLQSRSLTQSMSRKGNCHDNAAMESFFGTLKSELFYLTKFEDIEHLKREIADYIHYYNHDRIKMKLGGLSPVKYRLQASGS